MLDIIEQSHLRSGRHARPARAAPAHPASLRVKARTAPARGAPCEPNRTRAGRTRRPGTPGTRAGPYAISRPKTAHGCTEQATTATTTARTAIGPQEARRHRGSVSSAEIDRPQTHGAPSPLPRNTQRTSRSSAPRCMSTRQTRIDRGTRGRSPADEHRSWRNDPRPTVGTRPRLVHARPVSAARDSRAFDVPHGDIARRDASRFADPCRSAIPTSRHDHRRGNRHEPSSSTDRRTCRDRRHASRTARLPP